MANDPKNDPSKKSKKTAATLKTVLECPRCGVTMSPDKYEGAVVDFCDTCWGYWIGVFELDRILAAKAKAEVFSRDEQNRAGKAPTHPGDGKPLVCVRCGKGMSKLQVKDEWGTPAFFLDICRDHGVWLDTGEIKRAQILDEKSGAVRRALQGIVNKSAGD